jgi:hypothetical protein
MNFIIINFDSTLISVFADIKKEKKGEKGFGRFLTILNIFNEISFDSQNRRKKIFFIYFIN